MGAYRIVCTEFRENSLLFLLLQEKGLCNVLIEMIYFNVLIFNYMCFIFLSVKNPKLRIANDFRTAFALEIQHFPDVSNQSKFLQIS